MIDLNAVLIRIPHDDQQHAIRRLNQQGDDVFQRLAGMQLGNIDAEDVINEGFRIMELLRMTTGIYEHDTYQAHARLHAESQRLTGIGKPPSWVPDRG